MDPAKRRATHDDLLAVPGHLDARIEPFEAIELELGAFWER